MSDDRKAGRRAVGPLTEVPTTIAFYGRVATGQPRPSLSLAYQVRRCEEAAARIGEEVGPIHQAEAPTTLPTRIATEGQRWQ